MARTSALQQAQRKVRYWWRDDGMLELFATLPPEDGQMVLAAIESVAASRPARTVEGGETKPPSFPALDTCGARRAGGRSDTRRDCRVAALG